TLSLKDYGCIGRRITLTVLVCRQRFFNDHVGRVLEAKAIYTARKDILIFIAVKCRRRLGSRAVDRFLVSSRHCIGVRSNNRRIVGNTHFILLSRQVHTSSNRCSNHHGERPNQWIAIPVAAISLSSLKARSSL